MKTHSFAIDLLLLISILLTTSCAAPTPSPTSTPSATQTHEATSTFTPAPTATSTESPLPADFKDLQDRLGETAKLYDTGEIDTAGKAIMGMKDKDGNIIESVKSYADGTTSFTYDNTDLTIASIVVEKSSDGELAQLGAWHVENGKIIIDTSPAPKTVDDAKKFPKLAYLQGHAKEKEIDLTIHNYVSMATAKTAESEFDEVYFQGEKVQLEIPPFWTSQTYTFEGMKLTHLEDSWAYNQLIALKQGFFSLKVHDVSGMQKLDLVGIPIVVRNSDGSIFSMVGLAELEDSRVLGFLNPEKRTDALATLVISASDIDGDTVMADTNLQEFAETNNQELIIKEVIQFDMDQLPQEELVKTGYWVFRY